MPSYARVMVFKTRGGWDDAGDSRKLSAAMETIQRAGGKITSLDYKHAMGGNYETLIYLIQYEAPAYIEC